MRTITLAIALVISFSASARESQISNARPKPLSFIENKGQVTDQYNKQRKDIDVKLETPGMNVFVGDGAIHYQWYKLNSASGTSPVAPFEGGRTTSADKNNFVETYRMDVELVGANKDVEVVLGEQQEYYETHYHAYRDEGLTTHSYNRITYKNVYPGIDWVLYSKDNQLKYDFVLQAGADASMIQLRYNGATAMALENGQLIASTPLGEVIEAAPISYDAQSRTLVSSSYKLHGNMLSFDLPDNSEHGVVIDPSLSWGTYYGGSGYEASTTVVRTTTDKTGNVYLSGPTTSSNNIATAGAFQATISATNNAFLVKFNAAGVRQWSTYWGEILPSAITSDKDNNVYVTGSTTVAGLATAGAHQTLNGGGGYFAKFNTSGQRLWATYFGANGDLDLLAVFCDTVGVYIGGSTISSTSGVATAGSHQPSLTGSGTNGVLARFNTAGVQQWGTYYPGGIGAITGFGDSVIYAAGETDAATGCSTPGAHQVLYGGGTGDAFIAKFTTTGVRIWGTYYGGNAYDEIQYAAADRMGNLYVSGGGRSANNIATAGAFQPNKLAGSTVWESMLVKFSNSGTRLWGTYYQGYFTGVCTDSSGIVYVPSDLAPPNYATTGAYQPTYGGGPSDAFLTFFSPAGDRLYATYYGGTNEDHGYSIAYGDNKVYLAGMTSSTNAIATGGAHQTSIGGNRDAFLAQFTPDAHVYLKDIGTLTQLCKGDSLMIRYGVSQPFINGNVFTVQLSNASGSFASPITLGTKTGTQADSFKVFIPFSLANGSGYKLRILGSILPDTSLDQGVNINISSYPTIPLATATNPICSGDTLKFSVFNISGVSWSWTGPNSFTAGVQNPYIATVTIAATGDYIVTADNNGCWRKDTVSVSVGTTPAKPIANNNSPICAGTTLNLTSTSATPGVTYSWSGPMSFSSMQQNPSITAATPGHAGDYIVTASLANCHAKDTTTAIINSVSSLGAYASPNDTFCEGTLVSVVAVPFNGGTSPTFQWYKNGTLIPSATGMVYSTSAVVTGDSFYCRMIATGICTDPLELYSPGIKVTVLPVTSTPSVTISSNPVLPQPGQLTAFTATAINGGPTPTYQWLRNGQLVIGAMGANWSASNLHPYDQISCVVLSSDVCANPKTDTSSMIVVNFPTTIKNIDSKNWHVYPNPATNELTIEGEAGMQVTMLNVLGQEVYSGVLNGSKEVINISQFVPGNYVLQLVGADGSRSVVKVEKE